MTDKELKKLRRIELLELLVDQASEMEALQKKLEETQEALASREFRLKEAGSIAQAALEVNNVFASAQQAAQDYLNNLRGMEEEQKSLLEQTREKCRVMEEETRIKCEALLNEARQTGEERDPE